MGTRRRTSTFPPGLLAAVAVLGILGLTAFLRDAGKRPGDRPNSVENGPIPDVSSSSPSNPSSSPPRAAESNPKASIQASDPEAKRLLAEIGAAYRRLTAGRIGESCEARLRYSLQGQSLEFIAHIDWWREASGEFQARIEQSGRVVMLHAHQGNSQAWVVDAATRDLDRQVVHRPLVGSFSITDFYAMTRILDPLRPQHAQSLLDVLPTPLTVSPLAIMLGAAGTETTAEGDPWMQWLAAANEIRHLAPETVEGAAVERIGIVHPTGNYVLHLSPTDHLLRRIDYPPPAELDSAASDVRAFATFSIRADGPIEAAQARGMHSPDERKLVRYFVSPTITQIPERMGTPCPNLELEESDGRPFVVSRDDGEITLMVWFGNQPSSQLLMEQIERYFSIKDSLNLRWIAINVDPPEVLSSEQLVELARDWGIRGRLARDPRAQGRDDLGVVRAPTIVLVDAQGTIQLWQEGSHPGFDVALAMLVDKLRKGEDPVAALKHDTAEAAQRYQQALAEARLP